VPQAQCLLREVGSSDVVADGGRLAGLVYERLEDLRVENGRAEPDPVPTSPSLECDPVRRERLAKPGHVCLQAVRRRRRRAVTPDVVDEALVRYDLARVEQ
jgi:hypothetical protein